VEGPSDPNFWDRKNWQALCRSCHAVKTHQQGGAVNRAIVRKPPPPDPYERFDPCPRTAAWFR
jgi:5-methylcytosine-specific restriction endonuclease McrA